MTIWADNFLVGAANTELSARGVNSGGFTWHKSGGSNLIRSNSTATAAVNNAGSSAQASGYMVPAGIGADQYAQSTRALDPSVVGVAVRIGNSGSGVRGYLVRASAAAIVLYRLDPGGSSSVLQNIPATGNAADVLGLQAIGNQLRVVRNGAFPAAAVTDNMYPTGLPGLLHATTGTGIIFGPFEGGDLGGASAVPLAVFRHHFRQQGFA